MSVLALDIKGLNKQFKKKGELVPAVQDLSLQLEQGKTLGLIGANGAGKSTTIKCVLDLLRPTSGEISLFGVPSDRPESRAGVGFVAENSILNDQMSALEVVGLSLRQHHFSGDVNKQSMLWLEKLGMAAAAKKRIRAMSKGMAQRTALAAAFASEPKLLILDEPLSGLDPIGRKDVVDLLDAYSQEGGTLLFTSHVLHDVERLADDYCVIHKGRLAAFHTADDLATMTRSVVCSRDSARRRYEKIVERADLWVLLDQLKADGHELESIKPELSLEKIFYDIATQ